jgi:RecA-family ATPase
MTGLAAPVPVPKDRAPGLSLHPPAQDPVEHLKLKSFADWPDADPPEREWLVDGLIPMGTVTFLSGDGGLGKTLLAQQLAMAAALGRSWCGKPVTQTPSIALFCEDKEDEIRRRADGITTALGVARTDPRLAGVHYECRVGAFNAMMISTWQGNEHTGYRLTDLHRALRASASARQARLVVIDSLHDVFIGNENFRPEARAFVQCLSTTAARINGAVVVLAHPSFNGLERGSGSSGSTAWNNAVRSRLYLTMPEGAAPDSEIRVLTTVKSNYGRTGERIILKRRGGLFVAVSKDQTPKMKVARAG